MRTASRPIANSPPLSSTARLPKSPKPPQPANTPVLTPETASEPIVFNAPATKPVNRQVVEPIVLNAPTTPHVVKHSAESTVFNAPSVSSPQTDSKAPAIYSSKPSV